MIDALFIGSADDTNDRHHHTNTGKNKPCYTHFTSSDSVEPPGYQICQLISWRVNLRQRKIV